MTFCKEINMNLACNIPYNLSCVKANLFTTADQHKVYKYSANPDKMAHRSSLLSETNCNLYSFISYLSY